HRQFGKIHLQRTAGPYMWVISGKTIAGQNPPLSALVQKRTNAGTAELSVTRHKETFTSTVGMSAKCRVSVSDINYRDCAAPRSRRHSYGCVCRDHSQPRAFQLQS